MSFSLATVQQTFQTCSMGRAAHGRSVCGALIFATVSALCHAIFATPGICCGTGFYIEIDVVLFSLGILGYFFDFRDTNGTKEITESKKPTSDIVHGSPSGSRDQLGHERHAQHAHHTPRPKSDMHIIECVQRGSVAHTSARVLEAMHASIRLGHGGAAVKLFDQMLEEGVSHDAHLISKAIVDKFFNLVSDNLCDMRIRKDGLSLFDAGQAHGLAPSTAIQNRLIKAWKSKLPKSVVKYLLTMKSDGFLISRLSYFALIISSERSNPEMVLALFGETGNLGITLDKVAYNSVLGACYHLGMYDEIGLLFAQMADRGLTPDIKTYRIAINASLRSNRFEDTVSVLETMHGQRLKFNGQDYHNAIVYCISLQRVDDAVVLFNAMVQANVIPLERSIVCLRDAGRMSASSCLAI